MLYILNEAAPDCTYLGEGWRLRGPSSAVAESQWNCSGTGRLEDQGDQCVFYILLNQPWLIDNEVVNESPIPPKKTLQIHIKSFGQVGGYR